MINKIKQYISKNNLFSSNDKLLVAVSAGIDSMFLLHVLMKLDYKIEVIHCNFSLRAAESDNDQKFIEEFTSNNNIKIHVKKFDTSRFAKKEKISTQMAARDLRYEYFEEIRSSSNCNYIVIAHNSDDDVETFFINLLRGSGPKGLSGIRKKINKIVRPILSVSRNDIYNYVNLNNIYFREDSSNLSSDYVRNNFRNKIFPLLSDINPSFKKTILNQIKILDEFYQMHSHVVGEDLDHLKSKVKNGFKIKLSDILFKKFPMVYVYELFHQYGFKDFDSIYLAIKAKESGKIFLSDNFKLLVDREYIYIIEHYNINNVTYKIDQNVKEIFNPVKLKFLVSSKIAFIKNSKQAFLDFDKIIFPLNIRKWQNGDSFYPLGMKNKKKLSNFFIDEKLSLYDKDNVWLLCSNNNIIWVIGYRIDDRYKLTDNTKKMYIANLLN